MPGLRKDLFSVLFLAIAASMPVGGTLALEGGTGAYLLGSRDTFAGIVPAPGTYITESFWYLSGAGPTLSLGGQAVVAPDIDVWLNRLDFAHFFKQPIFGGTAGIVLTVPYAGGSASGVVDLPATDIPFKDTNDGFGDLTLTGLVGWHDGNFHYSAALSVFIPVGKYNTTTVDVATETVDNALNFGKNKWAFQPILSGTYFNPQTGFELSGSLSLVLNTENTTTNWLTAPELNFEAAVMQHLKNGLAFGVAGYGYQQLGEDSGSGADDFKAAIGAQSLEARVFGIGPVLTYGTKFGNTPVSFKLKYSHEFGAKRRFESEVVSGSVGFSF